MEGKESQLSLLVPTGPTRSPIGNSSRANT